MPSARSRNSTTETHLPYIVNIKTKKFCLLTQFSATVLSAPTSNWNFLIALGEMIKCVSESLFLFTVIKSNLAEDNIRDETIRILLTFKDLVRTLKIHVTSEQNDRP